jgi:cAMP-dependent protein kinase regulator
MSEASADATKAAGDATTAATAATAAATTTEAAALASEATDVVPTKPMGGLGLSLTVPATRELDEHSSRDDDGEEYRMIAGVKTPRCLPKMKVNLPTAFHGRGRQRSAGVFGESDDAVGDAAFAPPVVHKTEKQVERIREATKANFLFTSLEPQQLSVIIDAMSEKHVKAGDDVITQGAEGDFFYVIDSGKLDVLKGLGDAAVKVFEYNEKGSFGELALMYNAPRAATVRATTDGVLFYVDRATFRHVVVQAQRRRADLLEHFIAKVPLFSSLTKNERSLIADSLITHTHGKGNIIIKEGDAGDSFFLVGDGKASVTRPVSGVQKEVAVIGEGDFFGERALMTVECTRSATVTAVDGDCQVAILDRAGFGKCFPCCFSNASRLRNFAFCSRSDRVAHRRVRIELLDLSLQIVTHFAILSIYIYIYIVNRAPLGPGKRANAAACRRLRRSISVVGDVSFARAQRRCQKSDRGVKWHRLVIHVYNNIVKCNVFVFSYLLAC